MHSFIVVVHGSVVAAVCPCARVWGVYLCLSTGCVFMSFYCRGLLLSTLMQRHASAHRSTMTCCGHCNDTSANYPHLYIFMNIISPPETKFWPIPTQKENYIGCVTLTMMNELIYVRHRIYVSPSKKTDMKQEYTKNNEATLTILNQGWP